MIVGRRLLRRLVREMGGHPVEVADDDGAALGEELAVDPDGHGSAASTSS